MRGAACFHHFVTQAIYGKRAQCNAGRRRVGHTALSLQADGQRTDSVHFAGKLCLFYLLSHCSITRDTGGGGVG
jgi:hypothetical protein